MKQTSRRDFLKKVAPLLAAGGLASLHVKDVYSAPLQPTVRPNNVVVPASFVIYIEDQSVYAQNGKTGGVQFSGDDAALVIQSTIDALPKGGLVFIRTGTYTLMRGLRIDHDNIHLSGEPGASFLLSPASMDNMITVGQGNLSTMDPSDVERGIENVAIENVTLDGQKTDTDQAIAGGPGFETRNMGLFFLAPRKCTVRNVTVRNVGQCGIYLRATGPTVMPSSSSFLPLLYNTIVGCLVENARTGIYMDGLSANPSPLRGRGNNVLDCVIVQDWNSMNIDVNGNNEGFGIGDYGNGGTRIFGCHVEGYTPNPEEPSHTFFFGYALDGNSSAIISNCTVFDCYQGVDINPSGSTSGTDGARIQNLTACEVRYPLYIAGEANSLYVSNLLGMNLRDRISNVAGSVVMIFGRIKRLAIHGLEGFVDTSFSAEGRTCLLQTVPGISPAPDNLIIIKGDKYNLSADFELQTRPDYLMVRDVKGYGPFGAGAVSVGPSPFTYRNDDGVSEAVYIQGGDVTDISKNGVTIFQKTPATVWLEPSESLTISHNDAPAMHKDRK